MNLCEQLKDIVGDYFERYPNTSINSLATKSNVGASTLRRIMNNSIKGDPSPHTVLNIASAITKEKRLSKLIEMFDGPVGTLLKESFSAYTETSAEHTFDPDLNYVLKDRTAYFVYKLAANRVGVTQLEVTDLFGQLGRDKLMKLIDMGLIVKKGDAYVAVEQNFSLDLETIKEHLPELVKFWKPSEIERGLNLFYTLSESLSEEGIKKIKEIQKEAVKRTYDVMRSPFYEGNIPYFTVNLCETLDMGKPREVLQ